MAGHRLFNEDAFRPGGPCSTRSLAPKRLRRGCWSLRAAKLNEHVSQSVLVKSPISEFGSFFEMDYRLSISKNRSVNLDHCLKWIIDYPFQKTDQ